MRFFLKKKVFLYLIIIIIVFYYHFYSSAAEAACNKTYSREDSPNFNKSFKNKQKKMGNLKIYKIEIIIFLKKKKQTCSLNSM